jgi:hypothetical protein
MTDDEIVIRKAARTPEGIEAGGHLARWCDQAEPVIRAKFPEHAERCQSCAFRAGTLPNGDPVTLMDAIKCLVEKVPFMCHQVFDKDGNPVELCAGYAILMGDDKVPKALRGTTDWEFSKPVSASTTR